jgi:hypothetical protein
MQDWDPIGVRDVPEAQDEYDIFIPKVVRIIVQNGRAEGIAKVLVSAELDIDAESNLDQVSRVAEKLLNINSNPEKI